MHTTGEHGVDRLRRIDLGGEQRVHDTLPQGEAGSRADVAAALPSLEDEAARSLLQEDLQQARRGNVEVGGNAPFLELARLAGTAARDEGEAWRIAVHDFELLLAELGRHEAENADAPGPVPHLCRRVLEELIDLGPAHQSEGEERQAAAVRHRLAERSHVADPRHRPLQDRVTDADGAGERAVRGEGALCSHQAQVVRHPAPERLEDAAGADVTAGEAGREGHPLPERNRSRALERSTARLDGEPGVMEVPGPRCPVVECPLQRRELRPATGKEKALPVAAALHDVRLAAIEAGQAFPLSRRPRGFARQPQLLAENHAGGACQAGGRRAVGTPRAGHPERHRQPLAELLQEDERRHRADLSPRLLGSQDDAVTARGRGGPRGFRTGDLDQDASRRPAGARDQSLEQGGAAHGVVRQPCQQQVGQLRRVDLRERRVWLSVGTSQHLPAGAPGIPTPGKAGQLAQGDSPCPAGAGQTEVQQADLSSADRRDGQGRVAAPGRREYE